MIRFLVLYPEPTDIDAFERHYHDVHVPLAKQLPGLRRYAIAKNPRVIRGDDPYYLVAELEWESMDSLRSDFASPLGRDTAADVDFMAQWCPGIRSMICEMADL